jgi:hypothetical protein
LGIIELKSSKNFQEFLKFARNIGNLLEFQKFFVVSKAYISHLLSPLRKFYAFFDNNPEKEDIIWVDKDF